MVFDHVGMKTEEKKEGENWVESTRVWVTNPKEHPYHVEWLRYEPDAPVPATLKNNTHIAFRVDSIEEASKGLDVVLEPFEVGGFLRVGFFQSKDGTVVEFMEYFGNESEWFPEKK
jgi:hypothetical protein